MSTFSLIVGSIAMWELAKRLLWRAADFVGIWLFKRGALGIAVTRDRWGRNLFIPTSPEAKAKLDSVAGDCPRYWHGGRVVPEVRERDVYEACHHGENAQVMAVG